MRKECLELLRKWEQKVIKQSDNITSFHKQELIRFANFLELHCNNLMFDDITTYDFFTNSIYHRSIAQVHDDKHKNFKRFIWLKHRINVLINNQKYSMRAFIPKTGRQRLLISKNTKEHDFCGYICRFLIKDYTEFKNNLLSCFLKRI